MADNLDINTVTENSDMSNAANGDCLSDSSSTTSFEGHDIDISNFEKFRGPEFELSCGKLNCTHFGYGESCAPPEGFTHSVLSGIPKAQLALMDSTAESREYTPLFIEGMTAFCANVGKHDCYLECDKAQYFCDNEDLHDDCEIVVNVINPTVASSTVNEYYQRNANYYRRRFKEKDISFTLGADWCSDTRLLHPTEHCIQEDDVSIEPLCDVCKHPVAAFAKGHDYGVDIFDIHKVYIAIDASNDGDLESPPRVVYWSIVMCSSCGFEIRPTMPTGMLPHTVQQFCCIEADIKPYQGTPGRNHGTKRSRSDMDSDDGIEDLETGVEAMSLQGNSGGSDTGEDSYYGLDDDGDIDDAVDEGSDYQTPKRGKPRRLFK
jgi:hypothetical protein